MTKQLNEMGKFNFLLGNWDMEYKVPESSFSKKATGTGTFKRTLDDKYVYFDYSYRLTTVESRAHAIFAWDKKAKIYRYWWFESSGNFLTATCNFVNDEILCLNLHDTLLIQTFKKEGTNRVVLRMEHPSSEGKYELILEVISTKK